MTARPGNLHALALPSPTPLSGDAPQARLAAFVRRPVRLGILVSTMFVAGFIALSALVPIDAGAVAPGVVSPDGSRRTVQHLEGGIIREIRVRDGDKVTAGQIVVTLQATQAAASYDLLLEQSRTLAAMRARLKAEQEDAERIDFPSDMLPPSDPQAATIIQAQVFLRDKRSKALAVQKQIVLDRIRQAEEQIGASEQQIASDRSQKALLGEELEAKRLLNEQGLVTKPEILRLDRARAALDGDIGRLLGAIAEARQKIGELKTQGASLEAERSQEIAEELEKARADLADVTERLNASRDVLERTVIRAPVDGKVVGLRFKTANGVIRAGEAILDIVPTAEPLLIDARIATSDIDVVSPGLKAFVHLTAYSSRGLPRIEGTVRDVSADRFVDEVTGQPYFQARIEVEKDDLLALGDEVTLMAGMPAEVLIVTGRRTVLNYLLEPFEAAMRRGMRET